MKSSAATQTEPEFIAVTASIYPTFEDFWDLYDHKTGKKKCQEKWDSLMKKMDQRQKDQLMQHVEQYVQNTCTDGRARTGGKFIPQRKNPLTYLNGEFWNDEPFRVRSVADHAAATSRLDEKKREVLALVLGRSFGDEPHTPAGHGPAGAFHTVTR